MKKPAFLKPGDTIGACAPSARFDNEKMQKGIEVLKKAGFKVKVLDQIFQKKRYLAGEDTLRAEVVNQLFADPEVNGIICVRGGFGALKTLPFIDWALIKKNPKLLIGFSDATALLLSIMDKTKIPVIHGPNLTSLSEAKDQTIESFNQTVSGSLTPLKVLHDQVLFAGQSSGILKGGNLSTISHLIGTPYQPDFKKSILFFEDIGEPAYKIDRMLTQLKMAGLFNGIKGVITGSFENCDNEEYLEQILMEIFQEYNIPVIMGLKAGHGNINISIPMGVKASVDTEELNIVWK